MALAVGLGGGSPLAAIAETAWFESVAIVAASILVADLIARTERRRRKRLQRMPDHQRIARLRVGVVVAGDVEQL